MKIAFACDHRGFLIKKNILDYLKSKGINIVDCGTDSEASTDYPDYIFKAAELVAQKECDVAIAACHSGIGSAIAANKVRGVRAALVHTAEQARLSRGHNDANMLVLGSGFITKEQVVPIVEAWLSAEFEGDRHERRVRKITDYEKHHSK